MKEHNKGDITTLDRITGFKSLKTADQEDLKKLAADSENASTEMAPKRLKTEKRAGISDEAPTLVIDFSPSQLTRKYKDAELPEGWKAFSTVIMNETEDSLAKGKIAAFDFDGCLVKTSVRRHGADAWSLLYRSIPTKMKDYHDAGYKLVRRTSQGS
ncbi:hypothetical protein L7F22_011760 [Adiantum nelumboides]|nr:hypothetical protein [Adiantum nelumboides]